MLSNSSTNKWVCIGFEAKSGRPNGIVTFDLDFWAEAEPLQNRLRKNGFVENSYQLLYPNSEIFNGIDVGICEGEKIVAVLVESIDGDFSEEWGSISEELLTGIGFEFECFDVLDLNGLYSAENITNHQKFRSRKKNWSEAMEILNHVSSSYDGNSHNSFSIVKLYSICRDDAGHPSDLVF